MNLSARFQRGPRTFRLSSPEGRDLMVGIAPHRRSIVVTGCLAAASAVLEIAIIAIMAAFSSRMISGGTAVPFYLALDKNKQIAAGLLIVIAKIAIDYMYSRQLAHSIRSFESDVRRRLAVLLTASAWSTIDDSESGEIHALLWTTVARCREGFTQIISILTNVTSLLLMLIATAIAAKFMIIVIIVGLLILSVAFRPLISATKRTSHDLKLSYLWYGREITETLAMGKEARVLGVESALETRLASAGDASASAVARQSYFSSLIRSGYMNVLYLLAVVGLALVAGVKVSNPAPLAATVLLLYRSMTYGQGLQSGLQNIATTSPFFSELNRWIERLSAKGNEAENGVTIPSFEKADFLDVELRYPNGHLGVAHLTTSISRGDSIALIGPSGSGKSSLVALLLGLRDHTGGNLLVNGVALGQIDRRSWMSHLALVSQDCILFDATIEENVRAWRDIPRERVERALRQANVHDEVMEMDRGLETSVGEGGKRLSGGQRQRVALARALAGDPELLILDEPTSALDPASEQAVKQSLLSLKGSVTLVIIAHRLTTISMCERVLVLERGRLQYDGTPESVARESDFFQEAVSFTSAERETADEPRALG